LSSWKKIGSGCRDDGSANEKEGQEVDGGKCSEESKDCFAGDDLGSKGDTLSPLPRLKEGFDLGYVDSLLGGPSSIDPDFPGLNPLQMVLPWRGPLLKPFIEGREGVNCGPAL
jgi:hypothetical protein